MGTRVALLIVLAALFHSAPAATASQDGAPAERWTTRYDFECPDGTVSIVFRTTRTEGLSTSEGAALQVWAFAGRPVEGASLLRLRQLFSLYYQVDAVWVRCGQGETFITMHGVPEQAYLDFLSERGPRPQALVHALKFVGRELVEVR